MFTDWLKTWLSYSPLVTRWTMKQYSFSLTPQICISWKDMTESIFINFCNISSDLTSLGTPSIKKISIYFRRGIVISKTTIENKSVHIESIKRALGNMLINIEDIRTPMEYTISPLMCIMAAFRLKSIYPFLFDPGWRQNANMSNMYLKPTRMAPIRRLRRTPKTLVNSMMWRLKSFGGLMSL